MSAYNTVYESNYKDTYENLRTRSHHPSFSIETVRNELESLYKYDGLGWVGRGDVKSAEIDGAVAAYQVFLNEWRKERRPL